jgi:hypothetical protein
MEQGCLENGYPMPHPERMSVLWIEIGFVILFFPDSCLPCVLVLGQLWQNI